MIGIGSSTHYGLLQTLEIPEHRLFASRLSAQLPRYFSWRPDPLAEGTDAFHQQWQEPAFANPPWILIPRVLAEVTNQIATVVLVAPVWKTQAWYPVLLQLSSIIQILYQRWSRQHSRSTQHPSHSKQPKFSWPLGIYPEFLQSRKSIRGSY
jgi:hypothetical protein